MGWAWIIAAACALLMGAAIQRGATCLVAGVLEWLDQGKAKRLTSMLEASVWVGLGMLAAHALWGQPLRAAHFGVTVWSGVGAALMGLGAWVNGACVFGTVARFGSGDWAYAASPVGFFAGCLLVEQWLPAGSRPMALPDMMGMASWVLPLVLVAALVALVALGPHWRQRVAATSWWTPHIATLAIGATFLVMLLLVGPWAYTDVLAESARAMRSQPVAHLAERLGLLACLFGGAVIGGWRNRQGATVSGRTVLRCLAGGLLMGAGGLLVPGSNDGLILLGVPLLWPYAWVAVLSMGLAIAAIHWGSRRLA